MPKSQKRTNAGQSVYQLKVTLIHSQPPIWRRFSEYTDETPSSGEWR